MRSTVPPSPLPGRSGLANTPQAAAGGPCVKFKGIEGRIGCCIPGVNPGVAKADLLRIGVPPVACDASEDAVITVTPPNLDLRWFSETEIGERCLGLLAKRLPELRGVNVRQPDAQPTTFGQHRQRITIVHPDHPHRHIRSGGERGKENSEKEGSE